MHSPLFPFPARMAAVTGGASQRVKVAAAQQRVIRECMNSLLPDGALLSGACRYMEMRDAGAQNTGAVFGTGVHDAFASVAHNPMCARNDSRLTRQRPATDVTAGAVLHAASVQTVAPQAWMRTFSFRGEWEEVNRMPMYQPKAAALSEHLLEFRMRARGGDYRAASNAARYAEELIDDFDRWRKRHKKLIDLWQSDDAPEAA